MFKAVFFMLTFFFLIQLFVTISYPILIIFAISPEMFHFQLVE